MKLIIFILFLVSCSLNTTKNISLNSKSEYKYEDSSGEYSITLTNKKDKNKFILSSVMINTQKSENQVIEKVIVASEVGINSKKQKIIRPIESEYTAWIEGEKKTTYTKLLIKEKKIRVWLNDSQKKNLTHSDFSLPKSTVFCYFSQIPDCLRELVAIGTLKKSKKSLMFYVIWESYPFHVDLYSNLPEEIYSRASLRFEGASKGSDRFSVEIAGQLIVYHFSKNEEWTKMNWISQGITITTRN